MRRVIVIGAGVGGLECARTLRSLGAEVTVVERARGVGGRCATRRVEGQPVDHGVVFLHGSDPAFLAALAELPSGRVEWPRVVEGTGTPCAPRAYEPGEQRVAFLQGVSALPKHLAVDLDVRLGTRATGLTRAGGALSVTIEPGGALATDDVVLALPGDQARALLATLGEDEPPAARAVLEMVSTVACLTVIARYDAGAPVPAWDILYPGDSTVLLLAANEARKRPAGAAPTLVLQGQPRWSREHLDAPGEQWSAALLAEAGRLVGAWAAEPRLADRQRWRYARVADDTALTAPLLLTLPGGARLGLAGEAFAPGGGVQAALLSGHALARRLTEVGPAA